MAFVIHLEVCEPCDVTSQGLLSITLVDGHQVLKVGYFYFFFFHQFSVDK